MQNSKLTILLAKIRIKNRLHSLSNSLNKTILASRKYSNAVTQKHELGVVSSNFMSCNSFFEGQKK